MIEPHPLPEDAALRAIVQGVVAATGDRFFSLLVQHLAVALNVPYTFVTEFAEDRTRFHSLALWARGVLAPNFEVPLAGTPCETVLNGQTSYHPRNLRALFPEDKTLVDWRAESYCGVPMVDSSGSVIGHFAIVDDKPMEDSARAVAIMQIFAARAVAEIERLRFEKALAESEERFRSVVETAPDAIVLADHWGHIISWNKAAQRLFGYTTKEVLGRPLTLLMPARYRDAHQRGVERLRTTGESRVIGKTVELHGLRKDGSEFPLELSLGTWQAKAGTFYSGIIRDISERVLREQEKARLEAQNTYLQEEIRTVHNFEEMIGTSAAIKKVFQAIETVAATDATVLVMGETGTGKELIARAIHHLSNRKDRVLVKVNCSAIPAGLIESELFGHEKGAFTGALSRKIGRFELADGGTIFLDEIGDLPLELQAKLLRVLQEGEFERLGSSRTMKGDVRVIAATNRDLEKAMQGGVFRSDLYYRLNVFPIYLPALRERNADIPLLVGYFAKRYGAKMEKKIETIPQTTIEALQSYSWPGNVRELENVIERAVILSQGSQLDLGEWLPKPGVAPIESRAATLEEMERAHILETLERTGWRVSGEKGAAKLLGLKPTTLEARMKKLGITRKAS